MQLNVKLFYFLFTHTWYKDSILISNSTYSVARCNISSDLGLYNSFIQQYKDHNSAWEVKRQSMYIPKYLTNAKTFSVRFDQCRHGPVKCIETRNIETRQGSTHKKTTLLWKNGRKEGQEDYSTFVAYVRQQMYSGLLVFLFQHFSMVR